MLTLNNDTRSIFQKKIEGNSIPTQQIAFYHKWLRFYLDFCKKHQFDSDSRSSVNPFIEKLKSKNQSDFCCKQAEHAISLFLNAVPDETKDKTELANTTTKPILNHVIKEQGEQYSTCSSTQKNNNESINGWLQVIDTLGNEINLRNYSPKTLKSYTSWARKFQNFLNSKDSTLLNQKDVKDFLTFLAVKKKVAASTQDQAFNALLFLFRHVLKLEFGEIKDVPRPKRSAYIPVVLSRKEVDLMISTIDSPFKLPIKFLYGCGLRISECMNLRLHDFNLDEKMLTIHNGKGQKDRTVPLPHSIILEIIKQIQHVSNQHDEDLKMGYSGVFLPNCLSDKYKNANKELGWQWFFPAKSLTLIQKSKEYKRYHMHDTLLQKAIKRASTNTKLIKRATAHTFRHTYASHLLLARYDIYTIQKLMGHADIKSTLVYLQTVPSLTIKEAKSPLDIDL